MPRIAVIFFLLVLPDFGFGSGIIDSLKNELARKNLSNNDRCFLYGDIFNRFKVTQCQKTVIKEKEKEAQFQKQIIEEKQKEIIDSIHYAKRIQDALLPNEKQIDRIINKMIK